jgi:hypothetical protein
MARAPSGSETAYTTALMQLRRRQRSPDQASKLFAIMPLAVLDARRGKDVHSIPQYEDLTPEERFAAKILYEVVAEVGDPISNYPRVLGEISVLRSIISGLMTGRTAQPAEFQSLINTATKIVNIAREYGPPDPTRQRVQTSIDDFDWLEANRDPDLWHLIARQVNFDLSPTKRFVEWVVEQPDCDRATAAFLFLEMSGPECVANPSERVVSGTDFPYRLISRICVRSQNGDGFPISELTLSEHGVRDDQRGVLQQMLNISMTATAIRCPVPVNLLLMPFSGRRAKSPYVVQPECYIENGW